MTLIMTVGLQKAGSILLGLLLVGCGTLPDPEAERNAMFWVAVNKRAVNVKPASEETHRYRAMFMDACGQLCHTTLAQHERPISMLEGQIKEDKIAGLAIMFSRLNVANKPGNTVIMHTPFMLNPVKNVKASSEMVEAVKYRAVAHELFHAIFDAKHRDAGLMSPALQYSPSIEAVDLLIQDEVDHQISIKGL